MMVRKLLLWCGVIAALLYVGSDIFAATRWAGYSYIAQSVSELRAIGAPTRSLLLPILFVYSLLEIAFGVGVRQSASGKRSLRITGGLLIGLGVLDLTGPIFSLDLDEAVGSFVNMLHLFVTGFTVIMLLLVIWFGAAANGTWFRIYAYVTLVVLLVTAAWTFAEVPRLAANLPTPWLGVRERISIYSYMLYLAVLALVLLRSQRTATTRTPSTDAGTPSLAHR